MEPGVYRVVGTGDGIDPETLAKAFDPTEDPDAGIDPPATLREALDGLYWSVRRFV